MRISLERQGKGETAVGTGTGDDSQVQKGKGVRSADLTVPGGTSLPKFWHVHLCVLVMSQCLCTCSFVCLEKPFIYLPLSSFSGLSSAYTSSCYFIDIELIHSIVLISAIQRSDSVIHVYVPFSDSFPVWFIAGY